MTLPLIGCILWSTDLYDGTKRSHLKVIHEIIKRWPDSEFAHQYKAQQAAMEANLTTHEILKIAEETNKIVKETHQLWS
uniref:Uncharacterized protein n=1 Tax=Globodera rostochiensis TaxID=31243 RepID=A0A914HAU6_GLORO